MFIAPPLHFVNHQFVTLLMVHMGSQLGTTHTTSARVEPALVHCSTSISLHLWTIVEPPQLLPSIHGFNKVAATGDGFVDVWFGSSKSAEASASNFIQTVSGWNFLAAPRLRGDRTHGDTRPMPREARSIAPGEAIRTDIHRGLRGFCNETPGRMQAPSSHSLTSSMKVLCFPNGTM
ncbi:hypothetical protein [Microvirga zambiensis]|uniref:hypothetical protein n=1 Tax=Microvirga zambiensis TaxID=1402137 RepID=UPI00191CCB92|nr:hypothetical protein [Microvirga zambiensis]